MLATLVCVYSTFLNPHNRLQATLIIIKTGRYKLTKKGRKLEREREKVEDKGRFMHISSLVCKAVDMNYAAVRFKHSVR